MQLITDNYRKLNETLHNKNPDYGKSGHFRSNDILELAAHLKTQDILDYGCGKCTLAATIPFSIKNYDPAIRAFSEDPEPADIVACTDVIEHLEPELLDNVFTHMKSKTKKLVYMIICTRSAKKTLDDGRNAHLIVKQSEYWFNKVSEFFKIVKFIYQEDSVLIVGKPQLIQSREEKEDTKHEF